MRDNPNNINNNNNNSMESFYDETAQFNAPQNQTTTNHNNNNNNILKRPLTLDLNEKPTKRQRFNQSLQVAPVLSSPDLHMLKLASPELEKLIMNNGALQTPTPGMMFNASKVTTEQEDYAKGFEDALNSLHNNDNQVISRIITIPPTTQTITTNAMSGGAMTYTNLDTNYPVVAIKDEPQTVPESPSLSPIDMESQERIKLERKRQRNRVAASKCRKRKLERISKLEDKVKVLKGENTELGSIVVNLKQHVFQLKQQVIEHVNSGCRITITKQF